jgi:hypothetical protein
MNFSQPTISFVLTPPPADGHAESVVLLSPSGQNAWIGPHLCHDHFPPDPFQFISLLSRYSMLHIVYNENVVKLFQKEEYTPVT